MTPDEGAALYDAAKFLRRGLPEAQGVDPKKFAVRIWTTLHHIAARQLHPDSGADKAARERAFQAMAGENAVAIVAEKVFEDPADIDLIVADMDARYRGKGRMTLVGLGGQAVRMNRHLRRAARSRARRELRRMAREDIRAAKLKRLGRATPDAE